MVCCSTNTSSQSGSQLEYRLAPGGSLHQLQIIDDNQVDALLSLQAARLAAQLGGSYACRIIDPDTGLVQRILRNHDTLPLIILDPAGAQALLIDGRIHREQALCKLLFAHFQAED